MQDVFIPGQRWLSDAEAVLGLGQVQKTDERCVYMAFPASGENRIYAKRTAPLTRVHFAEGDRIEDKTGRALTVIKANNINGLLVYLVHNTEGESENLLETELSENLQLNRPQDKLYTSRIDQDVWFSLRYQAWLKMAEMARSPVFGLLGPRVGLIPHQLYIATQVARRHAPRVLLADEVGLGKTIEAGLIAHQLLLSERAQRVLVVVPEALIHQWLVEMRRRFNLRFSLFDEQRFTATEDENPFHAEQKVLCSLDFLASSPKVARAALAGDWDLLIVDEAHHLRWDEDDSSLEYDLIEALAEQTPGLLLLTATPEQLGRAGHFARLRLLDPHRFHDYHAFLAEEQEYQPVARLAAKLLNEQALNETEQAALMGYLGEEGQTGDAQSMLHRLLDRHGAGRVLFRNTRAAIKGFPERQLLAYPLPHPAAYPTSGNEVEALLTPELDYGREWTGIDPRLPWLINTLKSLRPEKVLLICAHAPTALDLSEVLLTREGIHAAVFHEEMEIVERDRAAAYFADPEDGTQLMICSEIGSEGRNFQFAHHLILFDLPLNPDLLEQRIGRLDRVGQKHTISIHAPYLSGGPSESLFRWYRDGLNAFTSICPAASAVFQHLEEDLKALLCQGGDADKLIRQASDLTARLNQDLENGRDRLLELHSHHPEESAQLVELIESSEQQTQLQDYMSAFWDAFGVEHELGPGLSTVLHPGRHMRLEQFPGLPEEGATVSFSRHDALSHEDREFLTWEHPMVRGAMDLLTSDDLGSAALTVTTHADFKQGTPLLELLYVVECPAPSELAVGRFLPPSCIRLLLDAQGRDHAQRIAHEDLQGQCLFRKRKLSETLLKTLNEKLRELFVSAKSKAETTAQRLVKKALADMNKQLSAELERMRELAKVNPNVREDELESLEAQQLLLAEQMKNTGVRLDAARVIVLQ
jgi:ATP-dependent helicase HepA